MERATLKLKAHQSLVSEDVTKYPISNTSSLTKIKIQLSIFPKQYIRGKNRQMKTQTLQIK